MRAIFIIVLVTGIAWPGLVNGQGKLNPALFDHARLAPDAVESNYHDLAAYLKLQAANDEEIAETIFYWIALHIRYHDDPDYENTFTDSIVEITLRTRQSGCEGTARLYTALARAAGLQAETIFGFAEGYSFDGRRSQKPNHGWNAVWIDDHWRLVDATWGSGGSTGEAGQEVYIQELDMRYFMADPKEFIVDHFPEEPQWQLLDNPVSKREFYSDEFELKRLAKLGW